MTKYKKVKLKHIAEKAGVSINTVSRALNDKKDISEKTKQKIREIAKNMGYVPDKVAGSLRSGATKTIAVVIPDILDPLMAIWVKDIEAKLGQKGYNIFVLNTDENYQREENALLLALSKKVDGIILCPCQKDHKDILFLQKKKINFVLLGRRFAEIQTDYVVSDDVNGGYLATKFLLEQGREKILFLNGHQYISSAKERYLGYMKALYEYEQKIEDSLIYEIDNTSGHSIQAIKEILERQIKFDGIFAFSDLMAWEVIYILQKLGYNIPQDIDIVGYDNIQSRFFYPYSLTTVNYPKRTAAYMAVEILLKKIANPHAQDYYQHTIGTNLFIRKNENI